MFLFAVNYGYKQSTVLCAFFSDLIYHHMCIGIHTPTSSCTKYAPTISNKQKYMHKKAKTLTKMLLEEIYKDFFVLYTCRKVQPLLYIYLILALFRAARQGYGIHPRNCTIIRYNNINRKIVVIHISAIIWPTSGRY